MVTVRINDGLGNQMFQYALGRTIAHRRGTALALDVSGLQDRRLRQYSLGVFNILENFAPGGYPGLCRLRALGRRLGVPGIRPILKERSFNFDPAVLDAPADVYLTGYWQSEKYFKEIEDIIRREFSFKIAPDQQNREMATRIKGVDAVAVHVRRGDYVSDPAANQFQGTCPPEYYRQGAQLIAAQVLNPHFFVFSDEPEWARANVELEGPTTFVALNGPGKGYEDLRLMALCRHHIIANSSFSWWGAWLANSGGMVVAPQRRVRSDKFDTRDLIPAGWLQL
jgi:hypothetical protein